MTRSFALLGHPLGHSLSPPIHKRLFELSGHTGGYDLLNIPTGELPERLGELAALRGYNVTIPYKVEMLPHMDRLDESARRYGALNTVSNGSESVGYNTDCYGFRCSVEAMGADLTRPVCVLGAGGVGRMFAIEASLCGAPVTLAVRESSIDKALGVQSDIRAARPKAPVRVVELSRLAALEEDFHLLINATPSGMYPNIGASPVDKPLLARCEYVFDSIYNPTETRLLREAREAGCKTRGGMAMLVWQAVKAHEIWDGAAYRPEDIEALIAEMATEVDRNFTR